MSLLQWLQSGSKRRTEDADNDSVRPSSSKVSRTDSEPDWSSGDIHAEVTPSIPCPEKPVPFEADSTAENNAAASGVKQGPTVKSPELPTQTTGKGNRKKTLKYQSTWEVKYPWLLPVPGVGALCKVCKEAYSGESKLQIAKEDAFVSIGFKNWNHALEKFLHHEASSQHRDAVIRLHQMRSAPVAAMANTHVAAQQQTARRCLLIIIRAVQYLARQGLPFRGHEDQEGNFSQMLEMQAKTDPELLNWLEKKRSWTSHFIHDELMNLMANAIIKKLTSDIRESKCFSVIVDGTLDTSNIDQHSFCVRYVDKDLNPKEVFLGLYEMEKTTGETIAKMVLDVLCRFQLPVDGLRGQTYDGAANMQGKYNGAQAKVKAVQPLALNVHCMAHSSNLASASVSEKSDLACKTMETVNVLGKMTKKMGKFRNTLKDVSHSVEGNALGGNIKPLCPTRFLARVGPMKATVDKYPVILRTLDTILSPQSNVKITAKQRAKMLALQATLQQGNTIMGLVLSLDVFTLLENLNKSLQGSYQTVSGAVEAAKVTIRELRKRRRHHSHFEALAEKSSKIANELDLEPICAPKPRSRNILKEEEDKREEDNSEDPRDQQDDEQDDQEDWKMEGIKISDDEMSEEDDFSLASFSISFNYFRSQYNHLLAAAEKELGYRLLADNLDTYMHLERILLNGVVTDHLLPYPEFNVELLKVQLQMFRAQWKYATFKEAAEAMRGMSLEVRSLFSEVERLLRLLMTIAVSSCEAERSFSSLRRVKTYLRSTMKQKRLNSLMVCHVHKNILDALDLKNIAVEFVAAVCSRVDVFGHF